MHPSYANQARFAVESKVLDPRIMHLVSMLLLTPRFLTHRNQLRKFLWFNNLINSLLLREEM